MSSNTVLVQAVYDNIIPKFVDHVNSYGLNKIKHGFSRREDLYLNYR
jgi:hypothetical protein